MLLHPKVRPRPGLVAPQVVLAEERIVEPSLKVCPGTAPSTALNTSTADPSTAFLRAPSKAGGSELPFHCDACPLASR